MWYFFRYFRILVFGFYGVNFTTFYAVKVALNRTRRETLEREEPPAECR